MPLVVLDVIAREYHRVPPSGTLRAPLLEPETAHRKRHALGRQRTLHVHAYELVDARGREELARLVTVGPLNRLTCIIKTAFLGLRPTVNRQKS